MKKILFGFVGMSVLCGFNIVFSADKNDFVEACLSASNMERAICECTARKAEKDLSPKGFEFVVASLHKNEKTTAKLRGEMSMEEMVSAGTFMTRAPAQCAQNN